MDISIYHETVYRYEESVGYSIQSLRMTPQPCDGQRVRNWAVEAPQGMLHSFSDSFGNVTHTLVIDHLHNEVMIKVRGNVVTTDTNGVVSGTIEPFPGSFYLRETSQTRPNGAIRALARSIRGKKKDTLDILHHLMSAIRETVDYRTGESDAMTTAGEALANGLGVCQDHAHIFISCARSLSIPARYVSGYLLNNAAGEETDASHAWVEAMVPELGWVGFDVANSVCTTEHYVRIGVGLDYQEASPIRGVRTGGGKEDMSVAVRVSQANGGAQ